MSQITEKTTVRILDPWEEYKKNHCGCKDGSRYNSCEGLDICSLRADHPDRVATPPTIEYRNMGPTPYRLGMLILVVGMFCAGLIVGLLSRA